MKDYVVAASFAWLLLSMRAVRFQPLVWTKKFNRFVANFSFSLYLIHFPLMLFVLGFLHSTGQFDCIAMGCSATDFRGLTAYVVTIAIILVAAWLFAQLTEQQTWRMRKLLSRERAASTKLK